MIISQPDEKVLVCLRIRMLRYVSTRTPMGVSTEMYKYRA